MNISYKNIPLLTAISLDSEYIRETTKLFNENVSSDTFVLPTTNTKILNKRKRRQTRKQCKNNSNLVPH